MVRFHVKSLFFWHTHTAIVCHISYLSFIAVPCPNPRTHNAQRSQKIGPLGVGLSFRKTIFANPPQPHHLLQSPFPARAAHITDRPLSSPSPATLLPVAPTLSSISLVNVVTPMPHGGLMSGGVSTLQHYEVVWCWFMCLAAHSQMEK